MGLTPCEASGTIAISLHLVDHVPEHCVDEVVVILEGLAGAQGTESLFCLGRPLRCLGTWGQISIRQLP